MAARLSSTEVKKRLQLFSKRFRNAENEQREATLFWAEFYSCFGISASEATVFEQQVRKLDGNKGRIDSFIPGLLIVEHKSRGGDLDAAYAQAEDYFIALPPEERPKYIVTSDFARIVLYDLQTKQRNETSIEDLPKNASWFKFLVEGDQPPIIEEREIDRSAAYTISKLHEALLHINFKGRDLEVFLTRLLFCLFADDTGIFGENGQFRHLVENAKEDGSDIGQKIGELFELLNTAEADRYSTLDDSLKAFPYINGNLFAERTRIPVFNSDLRELLISCATLDWSGISPAIFGAMFQGVLEEHNTTEKRQATRRELGAHYTSERNILRVINPLFLDDLREEFESIKRTKNKTRLKVLYDRLPTLRFFDPACGCGNFLVIAYRELRKLENDLIAELFTRGKGRGLLDVSTLCRVKLQQFYGIEIDESAAHIARVALYITDHQMNELAAERFGNTRPTIPLIDNPQVTVGNALRIDWETILPASECSFLFGNPPFVGHAWRNSQQVIDMDTVWGDKGRFGRLDYVTCWYKKSVDYMNFNKTILTALVSTNSIAQGEQVSALWSWMLYQNTYINFAHRTFVWSNEGKGVAAVHCVIIGFSLTDKSNKKLFIYDRGDEIEPVAIDVQRINPYLTEAANILLPSRANPISPRPVMTLGNKPWDGGYLILNEDEKTIAINTFPELSEFIKPFVGGYELINAIPRYCLWLKAAKPDILKSNLWLRERLEGVARSRLKSPTKSANEFAKLPYLFTQDRQPNSTYIAVPVVSSEQRAYIPIAYHSSDVIASDQIYMLLEGRKLDFSIINSSLHMAWVRALCGRLKSDFRYAPSLYNNFPFPNLDSGTDLLDSSADLILSVREKYSNFSLAQLYDRLSMPVDLLKAHERNDKAVDKAYGYKGKDDDASRVAFLFRLYEEQTSLFPSAQLKKKRTKKTAQ